MSLYLIKPDDGKKGGLGWQIYRRDEAGRLMRLMDSGYVQSRGWREAKVKKIPTTHDKPKEYLSGFHVITTRRDARYLVRRLRAKYPKTRYVVVRVEWIEQLARGDVGWNLSFPGDTNRWVPLFFTPVYVAHWRKILRTVRE